MELTKSTMKKGKSMEHYLISQLLKHDFDVYIPVVDSEGIDLIVKNKTGKHVEVQVKSRIVPKGQEANKQFILKEFKPRRNFFICCHCINTNEFWVMPSIVFHKRGALKKASNQRFMTFRQIQKYENYQGDNGIELLSRAVKELGS